MGMRQLCTLVLLAVMGFFILSESACSRGDTTTGGDTDTDTDSDVEVDTDVRAGWSEDMVIDPAAPVTPAEKGSCVATYPGNSFTVGYTQDPAIVQQVQTKITSMTLTEKANEMRGMPNNGGNNWNDTFRQPDNETAEIRGFKFRDGPRCINLVAELPKDNEGYSTTFPVAMARGAAFDLDLEHRIGQAIGDETLASGNTMMLAPTINILRHPAWGRAQETYGEDPTLLGRLGSAFVVGVQEYVAACPKHYLGNNIENDRFNLNAQMDEQTLREIYARHFEMVIKEGGASCIMAAYNKVNKTKSTENNHILNEVLRADFGFKGFVLSDWWSMSNEQDAKLDSGYYQDIAVAGVQAGLDLELPWALNYQYLEDVVETSKRLDANLINQSASRILEQKYRFKVVNIGQTGGRAVPTTTLSALTSIQGNQAHIDMALEAAIKSAVLLKNDNDTLPIKRDVVKTIAVLGATIDYSLSNNSGSTGGTVNFATDILTGDFGSSRCFSNPAQSVGPFAGIQAAAGAGITVISGASAADAAQADFIVVVAGLTPEDEGEEYTGAGDRTNFLLDGKNAGASPQNDLIAAAAALGKPMVVLLKGGSVIEMPWLASVPAVVMTWYPGQQDGAAIGQLLFGDKSFSGKLPITWPVKWGDIPIFNEGATTTMSYDIGYRYYDRNNVAPLFPFGYGLSYNTYVYSNLQLPCTDVTKEGFVDVQVDVTNNGTIAGDEVVFLFVSYPQSTQRRPIKELKGFHRVSLAPGQTKRVTLSLNVQDLKYWDMTTSSWQIETGPVDVQVGPSSADLPLVGTFQVI